LGGGNGEQHTLRFAIREKGNWLPAQTVVTHAGKLASSPVILSLSDGALAAAYGFGIVRNHPFIEGNNRTVFVATELFLMLNGLELVANDEACAIIILNLADGKLTEEAFADWLGSNTAPLR
jgi:hypothetical protein